jgi:hypothetical protein
MPGVPGHPEFRTARPPGAITARWAVPRGPGQRLVTVRVVLPDGTETTLPGVATGWTSDLVMVLVKRGTEQYPAVFAAADVTARADSTQDDTQP